MSTPLAIRTPLRRSEIGVMRPPQTPLVIANNDEEERRNRRRTIMQNEMDKSIRFEESETLKNCMQMFQDNKMNKDNAWSLSIIDALSDMMSNHHRALSNFKVAGSSLEASSRVYGLRVDCVHTDVLRLSHGLNKKKVMDIDAEPDIDDGDDNDRGNENNDDGGTGEGNTENQEKVAPKKKKRTRRQVATVTKNPDTINGKFDTAPMADPIWGKFNSVIGGVNSPNSFLQNILFSENGSLKMTSNYKFWNSEDAEEHSGRVDMKEMLKLERMNVSKYDDAKLENCVLRATLPEYKITNVPATFDDLIQANNKEDDIDIADNDNEPPSPFNQQDADDCMAMAFDMDAEVEPVPSEDFVVLDVDIGDVTVEEQAAINLCKGLKKKSVVIEDMRPINSQVLEYSYRPLESISRFWAGPSHWNFRNFRKTLAPVSIHTQNITTATGKENNTLSIKMNAERAKTKVIKNRPKPLNFTQVADDVFQKLDETKLKKTILSKKWDARKLKLPTNFNYKSSFFDTYTLAPNLSAKRLRQVKDHEENNNLITENAMSDGNDDDDHFDNMGGDDMGGDMSMSQEQGGGDGDLCPSTQDVMGGNNNNQTIMEISDNFIGAPDKVTRIVVPFAKRAKVIDMKQLKRCGLQSINNQFVDSRDKTDTLQYRDEKYLPGIASFSGIYNKLPQVLTKTMSEGLTPSVALYSVLHLCNEHNFRIFPQEDLKDFKLKKLQH